MQFTVLFDIFSFNGFTFIFKFSMACPSWPRGRYLTGCMCLNGFLCSWHHCWCSKQLFDSNGSEKEIFTIFWQKSMIWIVESSLFWAKKLVTLNGFSWKEGGKWSQIDKKKCEISTFTKSILDYFTTVNSSWKNLIHFYNLIYYLIGHFFEDRRCLHGCIR